ncbi:Hypothetical_protein [Hexamita inflata]|uniref:Hypothetical_protein n=1 Tax=Hexamita inflata TaxID=28002 RepID=A0AA86PH72_9EUKA|nr:Hypothetical protein HINF_LOCUS25916 [Hexamita inflata]
MKGLNVNRKSRFAMLESSLIVRYAFLTQSLYFSAVSSSTAGYADLFEFTCEASTGCCHDWLQWKEYSLCYIIQYILGKLVKVPKLFDVTYHLNTLTECGFLACSEKMKKYDKAKQLKFLLMAKSRMVAH